MKIISDLKKIPVRQVESGGILFLLRERAQIQHFFGLFYGRFFLSEEENKGVDFTVIQFDLKIVS